jgi:D-glycero-alpha-D-manno-heptose-7-phosphate kinase
VGEPAGPLRVVNAVAPIRICDNGGWTDTWFARHGKVFNIGVSPYVEVQVKVYPRGARPDRIVLGVENYDDRYAFEPGAPPGEHPLLETTIDDVGVPDDASVEISIFSDAPAGGSTGTSAAAAVALIASAAHRVESDRLGIESGIQDQLCAAFGGINYIEMTDYPEASVSQIAVPDTLWWELEHRLVLVFLGRSHVSSEVHERVIASLEREGGSSPRLEALRRTAEQARDAVLAADFPALGRAMTRNTDAQGELHASLVGKEARAAIEVAAANGALGWKVNGAGGEGGSVTLLSGPDWSGKRRLLDALRKADTGFEIIPTRLSRHGVRVRST